MRKVFVASMFFLAALILTAAGPSAHAELSCQEKCLSYCCTDSKCTKKKQSECYYDCLNSCNDPQKQNKPVTRPPHS